MLESVFLVVMMFVSLSSRAQGVERGFDDLSSFAVMGKKGQQSLGVVTESINSAAGTSQSTGLIIGAGPAGLAAGIELLRQGWNAIVFELRNDITRSNVLGINQFAVPWFRELELEIAFIQNGFNTQYYGPLLGEDLRTGRTAANISVKRLQKILLDRFVELGGKIYGGAAVDLMDDDHLSIQYRDEKYSIDTSKVQLVLVSDGAHSEIRTRLARRVICAGC